MKRLASVVARVTGNSLMRRATFDDWLDLFQAIADYKPSEKKVLAIDEFPYLVKTNSAFPSILQNAWDEVLRDNDVMLILSGSLIGMMQKHALSYDSPLYGRRTTQIRLAPLPFADVYTEQGGGLLRGGRALRRHRRRPQVPRILPRRRAAQGAAGGDGALQERLPLRRAKLPAQERVDDIRQLLLHHQVDCRRQPQGGQDRWLPGREHTLDRTVPVDSHRPGVPGEARRSRRRTRRSRARGCTSSRTTSSASGSITSTRSRASSS